MITKDEQGKIISKGFKPSVEPKPQPVTNDEFGQGELKYDSSRNRFYYGNPLPNSPIPNPQKPDIEDETRVTYKLGQ